MTNGLPAECTKISITDSRDYYTRLAMLDREQFELESHPGALPIAEFHKRLQAMKQYRELLKAVWGRPD